MGLSMGKVKPGVSKMAEWRNETQALGGRVFPVALVLAARGAPGGGEKSARREEDQGQGQRKKPAKEENLASRGVFLDLVV